MTVKEFKKLANLFPDNMSADQTEMQKFIYEDLKSRGVLTELLTEDNRENESMICRYYDGCYSFCRFAPKNDMDLLEIEFFLERNFKSYDTTYVFNAIDESEISEIDTGGVYYVFYSKSGDSFFINQNKIMRKTTEMFEILGSL